MYGVVFEIEIKINIFVFDFLLIGVLIKYSFWRIFVCFVLLNGGYKILFYLNYGIGY